MPDVSRRRANVHVPARPGFRFSPPSGAPVTAHAFRRAIERALHPRTESYAADWFLSDIVGCARVPSRARPKRLAGVKARAATR